MGAEIHSQLLAAETEMNNKNKEIQNLHNSLTEAMVSKERLEQRVMELQVASQHSMPDDALQARAQVRHHSIMSQLVFVLFLSICLVVYNINPIDGEKWHRLYFIECDYMELDQIELNCTVTESSYIDSFIVHLSISTSTCSAARILSTH